MNGIIYLLYERDIGFCFKHNPLSNADFSWENPLYFVVTTYIQYKNSLEGISKVSTSLISGNSFSKQTTEIASEG